MLVFWKVLQQVIKNKCQFQNNTFLPFQTVQRSALTSSLKTEERKEMFYLMMHSTHFIYGYMVSDIW